MAQEVLSMEVPCDGPDVDIEDSHFRMRVDKQVKYILIELGILPVDVLSFPLDLLAQLPPLPAGDWVQARVARGINGNSTVQLVHTALARVHIQWYQNREDVLSLPHEKYVKSNVRVVQYASRLVIAKITTFISLGEQEKLRYTKRLTSVAWARRSLGISSRVTGCLGAVQHLHALDIIHGDQNRYNFIVASDGTVTLIDFEIENAMPARNNTSSTREPETAEDSDKPLQFPDSPEPGPSLDDKVFNGHLSKAEQSAENILGEDDEVEIIEDEEQGYTTQAGGDLRRDQSLRERGHRQPSSAFE
ncbi:hypothetical protein K503DRAFT_784589 [Rhizopogon vinicolor AM-OR11-026]|uniref:Protein kinase domain-containing protein n=1 Tax=Rhizopogon vinicolor AM-OR11-026 TaxID=1314800 RepID=A0A1B7MU13_9AGAM|nr:hypothetical protein K503DRAFT_784589 [Rhizopogon vinicolor AM-OR11-026]